MYSRFHVDSKIICKFFTFILHNQILTISRLCFSPKVLFLDIAMPKGMSRAGILGRYDNNLGFPTPGMVTEMKTCVATISSMTTYADWFQVNITIGSMETYADWFQVNTTIGSMKTFADWFQVGYDGERFMMIA
jgi:hypothetical protein